MKKSSIGFLVVAAAVLLPVRSAGAGARANLPFRMHDSHMILVQGSIGRLENLNLQIDTGATRTVISSEIAEELGLDGSSKVVVVYGRKSRVREVVLPCLKIRGLEFRQVAAQVMDLTLPAMDKPVRIDALIGLDLLRRTGLSIDFAARRLEFGPVTHSASRFSFYGKLPIIPVPLSVAGRRLTLLLDTGAAQLILYRRRGGSRVPVRETGEELRIQCAGRKATLKKVRLRDVSLREDSWPELPAYVLDTPVEPSAPDGVLGVVSLGLSRLNLDFDNNIVSWER